MVKSPDTPISLNHSTVSIWESKIEIGGFTLPESIEMGTSLVTKPAITATVAASQNSPNHHSHSLGILHLLESTKGANDCLVIQQCLTPFFITLL